MKNSKKLTSFKKTGILIFALLLSSLYLSGATIKSVVEGDWNDNTIWEGGVVPASGDDIIIETEVTLPISFVFDVHSLTIASGGTLNMDPESKLNVTGNWIANGAFSNFNEGTVEFMGTGVHTITSSSKAVFYNLTVAASNTVVLSTALEILGGGVLLVNGILDLNNQLLTLKSTAPSDKVDVTARLGRVTGEIKNAMNFTVERYIPIPFMINGNRSFVSDRYVCSPVRNLQAAQWAENVIIIGGSGANAFREIEGWRPTLSTLKSYYEPNTSLGVNGGFRSVLDKTTVMNVGQGYALAVGLDGNANYTTTPKEYVVLKSKGEPVTGNVSVPVSKSGADPYGWNLVGNPYPSDIDWNLVWNDNQTTVSSTVSLLDPEGGKATSGQYYYYNARTGKAVDPRYGLDSNVVGRANGALIASSQGFFVFAREQGIRDLNFTELHKPSTYLTVEANFRLGGAIPSVNIGVSNGVDHDNTYVFFHVQAKTLGFDADFDAFKSANTALGISTNSFGKELAMNGVSLEGAVNVPVTVEAAKQGAYQLTVVLEASDLLKSKLYLKDAFTGSLTKLEEGKQTFSFEIAANKSTVKRFSIVTEDANVVTGNEDVYLASSEMKIYPNPVSGDKLSFQMPKGNGLIHQVEIMDLNGVKVYKTDAQATSATFEVQGLSQVLTGGVYSLKVIGEEGVKQQKFVYLK